MRKSLFRVLGLLKANLVLNVIQIHGNSLKKKRFYMLKFSEWYICSTNNSMVKELQWKAPKIRSQKRLNQRLQGRAVGGYQNTNRLTGVSQQINRTV